MPDPSATSVPRPGRGSLAGRINRTDDWDAADTGGELARDFGLLQ